MSEELTLETQQLASEVEITDETGVDDLLEYTRDQLDAMALVMELVPGAYKNKAQIAGAILKKVDGEDEDEDPAEEDPVEMKVDPGLADINAWEVLTQTQYLTKRGKKKMAQKGDTIRDIPNVTAQDLYHRGALKAHLR